VAGGADLEARQEDGDSPLHDAASQGHPEIAEVLIDAGADVNAPNAANAGPLHVAALAGHEAVVDLLLASGADFEATDGSGKTPRDLAEGAGHGEIVRLLVRARRTKVLRRVIMIGGSVLALVLLIAAIRTRGRKAVVRT
jgi:ankyrin repeat protein